MSDTTPAGWFPDPELPGQQRYWDGRSWTEHRATLRPAGADQPGPAAGGPEPTIPLPPPPPGSQSVYAPAEHPGHAAPPPARPAAATPASPWYRKGWVLAVGGVIVGYALGASAGGDAATENTASDVPTTTETVTVTAEPTAQPVSEPSETEQAADDSQVGGTAGGGGDTFVIPDETGKSLQAAQDDLQAISGNPFFFSDSEDATGDDREAILDSGWQVCSQDPAPGTEVRDDEDDVVFFVVRVSEDCP